MVAIATLILVLLMSLIVVRVAAEALVLTGLSRETARFQARSAWTGTGFTTQEAEQAVNHPVRRQIISILMFLRGIGVITAASALMLSFVHVENREDGLIRMLVLVGGAISVWLLAISPPIERATSRVISWTLKNYTDLDVRDYAGLLHLVGEYAVMELKIEEASWLKNRRIAELDLPDEGILVLGVEHPDGHYVGAPRPETVISRGDRLLLYGRSPDLAELGRRKANPAGDAEHEMAIAVEQEVKNSKAD